MSVSDGKMKLGRNEKASGIIKRGEEGESRENRGSIRHRPPPRPPLIDSLLGLYKCCLPCGSNIYL